jgi:DNA-binding NtrC family response regulator
VGRPSTRLNRPSAQTDGADGTGLVGVSAHMRAIRAACARYGPTGRSVVIVGESGTGKYLVARLLHRHSGRSGPFVSAAGGEVAPTLLHSAYYGHCRGSFTGATGRGVGLLEAAERGTLFLDELQDQPAELQAALLSVTEGRGFVPVGAKKQIQTDLRVVAASQRPLRELVSAGRLREDLMYRLRKRVIVLLPLRERPEDIAPLAEAFLARLAASGGPRSALSPEALAELERHRWPGNVRELEDILDAAAFEADGRAIGPEHLPAWFYEDRAGTWPRWASRSDREERLRATLVATAGNVAEAARRLGVTDRTVRRWAKEFGICLKDLRGGE